MATTLNQILTISTQCMNSKLEDLSNVSNSIANVNTVGYKTSRLNFQELLEEATLSGIKTSSSQLLMAQGSLESTGVATDLAIEGDGFFCVTLPDGTAGYTRDGSFQLDSDKNLVTAAGYKVEMTGTIPDEATEVAIDENGTVTALVDDEWVTAGTIQLANFNNPGALLNYGDNIYIESVNSGEAETGTASSGDFGTISAGYLEGSNVDLAYEMSHLIIVQRSFELASKAFQTTSDMMDATIHLRKV